MSSVVHGPLDEEDDKNNKRLEKNGKMDGATI
jgi:hypothetical protein